jgi:protein SCO1
VSPGVRNTVLACAAFIAIVLGALLHSVLREPLLDAQALQEHGTFLLPAPRELKPFRLTDHNNVQFDNASLTGHWSLVFFGFTACPDICPVTLSVLAQVEKKLADSGQKDLLEQLKVYFVSVDPERDDAAALGRFISAFSPRFTGVTGSRDALAEFAAQLNAAFMKVPDASGGYVIDHTGNIVVIDPQGRYVGFIKLPHDADNIVMAYRSIARSS